MEYDIETNKYGDIIYYKKGTKIIHREDGPALETNIGRKYWYIDGQLHRKDGPAIEYESGDQSWYINGKAHRIDGPALDWKEKKIWYINGKCHRENGPAVEYKIAMDKDQNQWWINGQQCSPEKELILNKW